MWGGGGRGERVGPAQVEHRLCSAQELGAAHYRCGAEVLGAAVLSVGPQLDQGCHTGRRCDA